MPRQTHRTLFALLLLAALAAGCGSHRDIPAALYSLRVGAAEVRVEVAFDEVSRARGLSGRASLEEGHGMLFVFPEEAVVSFWMKGTHLPLSIAFITSDGKIAEVQDMKAEALEQHRSAVPVTMALEMPLGWFGRSGVKPGDTVVLPKELSSIPAR